MPKGTVSYGNRSLAALGLMLLGTQHFYPIVLLPLERGQNAAWLITLLSGVVTALMVWPVATVLRQIPRGSLVDVLQVSVGKPGLILYAICITALFCYVGGLVLRESSEMALTAFFPHTPQTFATTALLLGALYAAHGSKSSLVRFGRTMLGLILIAILLIVVGTVGWGTPRYLLPFWGPGPGPLLLGTPIVSMIYGPIMVLLFLLAGGVSDRPTLTRWLVAVPLVAAAMYAVVKADLVMVFAYPLGRNIPYPLHEAARLVVGGRFFDRVEGIWLLVWVLATMLYLGALLHGAALLFTKAFAIPKPAVAIPPLATVFLTTAFFPHDQATTIAWHELAAPASFVLTLVVPLICAGVAFVRMRR